MQAETHIINNCVALLEQAVDLIERLEDRVYVMTSPISPKASIGGHLRHVLEFYQSFLCGIESGRVNYNRRERDATVEHDRHHTVLKIGEIAAGLQSLLLHEALGSLVVATEDDGATAPFWASSSVLRELDFLQSHTIHHYSLIAMLLRSQAIEPGADFGVAPSTLQYWKRQAACAQ